MKEQLYTVEEVARALHVSRWGVLRLLRSGKLRGMKIGGLWRVAPADLAAYQQAAYVVIELPDETQPDDEWPYNGREREDEPCEPEDDEPKT